MSTFVAAAKNFFGLKPGQGLMEFQKELKALTLKDRQELAEGMRAVGIDCDMPQDAAQAA